jgi:hypothetical protein
MKLEMRKSPVRQSALCSTCLMAEKLGCDERKTQRQLRKFMDLGLIRRIGQGRASRYEVLSK